MIGPRTGKEIVASGAPVWTPAVLAALAQLILRDLQKQRTPEAAVRTPDKEQLIA